MSKKNKGRPVAGNSKKHIPTIRQEDLLSSMSEPEKATRDALETLGKQGVVKALRGQKQGIAELLHNTDCSLWIKLSVVYGAGLIVETDDDQWQALCEAEEWIDHPKLKPKRNDALRYVLRLAVGFDGQKADKSVHRYYKALKPLFDEKVPASELPSRIQEAGGIEKMRQSSSGPAFQVSGLPAVLAEFQKVDRITPVRLWANYFYTTEGVVNLEILEVKPPKTKDLKLPKKSKSKIL